MKTVFSNDQIRSVFLAQSQAHGRTSNSSQYFEGNVMFSYGSHYTLAVIKGNTLLVSKRNSSVTTNSHNSALRYDAQRAGFTVIEVENVNAQSLEDHKANAADMVEQSEQLKASAKRRRKESYKEMDLSDAAQKEADVVRYAGVFSSDLEKAA